MVNMSVCILNFYGDEAPADMLTNFVDGANVGMMQGGSSASLTSEAF
jgi:hypothetical protein